MLLNCLLLSLLSYLGMQILDGRSHLIEVQLCLEFIKFSFLNDLVEQLPTLRQLQHDVQMVFGVDNIFQVNDVGM